MERYFDFHEGCVRVLERGPPPRSAAGTLIFLHGRYGTPESWERLTAALSRRFYCLGVELPGFGRSEWVPQSCLTFPEFEKFFGKLVRQVVQAAEGAGKVVLVGHDLGGTLAQLAIRDLPGQLAGMVLLNSGTLTQSEQHPCSGALRSWRARHLLSKLLSTAPQLPPDLRPQLELGWRNPRLRAVRVRALELLSTSWPSADERESWRRLYERFPLPVLLLWGRRDILNPPENGFALLKSFKQAEFFELDQVGHWPHLEDPEWVFHKISEFLFKLEPAAVLSGRKSLSR